MNILEPPSVPVQIQEEAVAQLRSNIALRRYIEAIVQREVVMYLSTRQPDAAHIRMTAIVEFAKQLLAAQIIAALLPTQPH